MVRHAQVLEDQDRRRQAAVRRVDLALVGHHLEHDGGAGQRDQESQEQRHTPGPQKREARRQRRQNGEAHLGEPAHQDLAAHFLEPAQREFDTDCEQQEDDADFGESFDVPRIGDEPERIGAKENAGDDEAGQRGQLEPVENENDQQRAGKDDGEVA